MAHRSHGGHKVSFKVDTGADVTIIPLTEYCEPSMGSARPANEKLMEAGRSQICTLVKLNATVPWKDVTSRQTTFMVDGVEGALL